MTDARHRIRFWTAGDERRASTRYRVLAHLDALRVAGWDSQVCYPVRGNRRGPWARLRRAADLLRDLSRPGLEEVVFIQRKTYPAALARWLGRQGRLLVFDFDDAIDLPPPGGSPHPSRSGRYRRNFEATVNAMDVVLCGNRELMSRVPHERCELLPTPIDTERFRPDPRPLERPMTLGWVGHSDNLPYLEALADPLRELAGRHPGLRLIVAADRPPHLAGIDVEFRQWSLATEISSFDDVGIGLMPLEDSPWARGKCAFKAIQYMALGIPAVASPVGANAEVIRTGETGFLPATDHEWVEVLDRLLCDPRLAERVGRAGRRVVETSYSLSVVSRRLVAILGALVASSSSKAAQSRA